ncbi:hypothetical protein EV186_101263 [Labedaea rhizosphaerae]|uniref:Uncharacterized protein n=1 Tax=Labedaea rhizosphaerae TaxID=598644 RepID=A0A4R6SJT6_LABRH|nr:hypothetical protein EV186_101263 [Labedaea rhizosphaerae]
MESIERAPTINPDLAQDSHGRVGRRTIYVGGAYCPQNQPRAAEPPEPRKPLEQSAAYTTGDDLDDWSPERGTPLDRLVATWPAWVRIALVAAVLVLGAVAMLTAGAGVGAVLTGTSFLP